MTDIENRFLEVTSKLIGSPVTMNSNLKHDLDLDSLGMAELLLAYEDEFDIFVDPSEEEIRGCAVVREVFYLIQALIEAKS